MKKEARREGQNIIGFFLILEAVLMLLYLIADFLVGFLNPSLTPLQLF